MQQGSTRPERRSGYGAIVENGQPIARVNYAVLIMHEVFARDFVGTESPQEGRTVNGTFMVTEGVMELAARELAIRLADGREFPIDLERLAGIGQYRFQSRL